MPRSEGIALSGSLAVFSAHEVLQWLVYHVGETVIAFELPEGLEVGRGILSVHVDDGSVRSLKTTGFVPLASADDASPPASTPGVAMPTTPAPFLQPRRGTLGSVLIEKKLIDPGQLRYALALQRVKREKENVTLLLGEVLIDMDVITSDGLEVALQDLALLRFAELFNCKEGSFNVVPGRQPPPFVKVEERVDRLMLRAAHLADGLGFGGPSDSE